MPKIFKRKELPWQTLEEKTLILSSEMGEVHQLNQTGTWIWNNLQEAKSLEDLVGTFLLQSSASKERVEKDFHHYLEALVVKKLVDLHE